MSSYKFECTNYSSLFYKNKADATIESCIVYEFEGADLESTIRHFECFLRGSGFIFSGDIGIIKQDEEE